VIWFKGKLLAILAGTVAVLLFVVKVLAASRRKAKKQVKQYKAELEFKDDVDEMETELSSNYQPHRAKIVNADKDETFDVLSDPDSVRMRDK